MKFNDIVKLYEAKQKGPPYIERNIYGIYYYKDPYHELLHRLDGPAVEGKNGTKEWYKDGELHRLDGPAIEHSNGDKEWYKDGKLHRLDGPAIIRVDGTEIWSIDDERLTSEEIEEQKKKIAIKSDIQSHKNNRIDPGMLEDYL